jgi:hypothetical protein
MSPGQMYRFANEIVKRLPAPLLRWNWLRLSSKALHFFFDARIGLTIPPEIDKLK